MELITEFPQQELSNRALFEQYHSRKKDGRGYNIPSETERDFLYTVHGFWWGRYYWRSHLFEHRFADAVAKELLIARTRAHNALYSTLPDVPAEQIAWLERASGKDALMARARTHFARHPAPWTLADVPNEQIAGAERAVGKEADGSTLLAIPSYGPSFISLWTEAKKQGLSHIQTAEYIRDWGGYISPAAERYYKRKAKKQPLIDSKVTKRLAEVAVWRQTGDPYVPWEAEVEGQFWLVGLNDFPDELMYTLLIDGKEIGDFNDWPQAWDRGEPKPAIEKREVAMTVRVPPKIKPAALLKRYQNGEQEAVWRDLVALGPEVRNTPYKEAAWAVAQETMRRAAHNVKLLVERLRQLDYSFHSEETYGLSPTTKKHRKLLSTCDGRHLWIPLSLRVFGEEVGQVHLLGSHPALSPRDDNGEPLLTDPLGFEYWPLASLLEDWNPEDGEPLSWLISADPIGKAWILMNDLPEDHYYTVQLPNAGADAVLQGEPHKITFVEYLRLSFRWGGFPGWEKYKKRPEKELAFLREGLLPL